MIREQALAGRPLSPHSTPLRSFPTHFTWSAQTVCSLCLIGGIMATPQPGHEPPTMKIPADSDLYQQLITDSMRKEGAEKKKVCRSLPIEKGWV